MGRITDEDPTGQNAHRIRSTNVLDRRLSAAERGTLSVYRELPAEPTAGQLLQFRRDVSRMLDQALLETDGDQPVANWYWEPQIEQPYRQGALAETRDLNTQVRDAILAGVLVAGMPPRQVESQAVLSSPIYRRNFSRKIESNFNTLAGLSSDTTKQILQQVNLGIDSGLSKSEIAKNINERFDVSKSSAKRIAHTEVNKAYNDARVETVEIVEAETGLKAMVEHVSALLPTTRESHARRHGNLYTPKQQQEWWNSGANRINCYCSARGVLTAADE